MSHQTCTKCGQEKEKTEFNRGQGKCKLCIKAYQANLKKNGPTNSAYNKRATEMPATTVFSINPSTGKPYVSFDYVNNLALKHINLNGKNLLSRIEVEDLKQEMIMRLCISGYDPTLSKPNTFMIVCFNSVFARVYDLLFRVRDKHKEISDFIFVYNDDGNPLMATEVIGIERTTPEDILLAKELLEDFNTNPPRWGKSKKVVISPRGWKGRRKKEVN